jgi:hypothetical protein
VQLPESWLEIKWRKFLDFTKIINSYDADIKKGEEEKEDTDYKTVLRNLEYNTKILSFWTGCTTEEVSHWDMKEAEEIMQVLSFVNLEYVPIEIKSFTIGEEKFLLPKDLMKSSSFGRYIEAEQLEIQSSMIDQGKIEYMPRQIAILCKKEGESEKLDDDIIDNRAELFKQLDMATIWDVAFFLNKLEQGLLTSFLTYQAVVEMKQLNEQPKAQ